MPETSSVLIRALDESDKEQWSQLFHTYAGIYDAVVDHRVVETVWSWFHEPVVDPEALVAEVDGKIVGFAHYMTLPSALTGECVGLLDNLYVSPDVQGLGVGRKLIMGVFAKSKEKGWTCLRWTTMKDNHRAQALYDTIAVKTDWVLYEMTEETLEAGRAKQQLAKG